MTKLLEEKELAEIRDRDVQQYASCLDPQVSVCAQIAIDRRALLSHVAALDAERDHLQRGFNAACNDMIAVRAERDSALSRLAAAERALRRARNFLDKARIENQAMVTYQEEITAISAALSSQEQKCETPVECPECGGDVATGAHQLHCTLD